MDTNIVHESMGLASPGLCFMLCKRLLVTNVRQAVAGEQGRERMNLPSALFHLKRLEWGCFNFRDRAFFLTNDGDNLSGIELVLLSGFPQPFFFFFWLSFSLLELRTVWSYWAKQKRLWASLSSRSPGIGWVCPAESLCRCLWSHSDSQRLRVRQGLDSVVFGGEWSHPLGDRSRSY